MSSELSTEMYNQDVVFLSSTALFMSINNWMLTVITQLASRVC